MRFRTAILALLVLVLGSPSHATEPADDTTAAAAVESGQGLTALELASVLGGHDGISMLMAASADQVEPGRGSSCYIGCYPQLDSICSAGQVAQVTATGPIERCGLADIRCVERCVGPIVRCDRFADCLAF